MTGKNDKRIKDLALRLASKGIFAMYGGVKGHGFWLYRFDKSTAEKLTNNFSSELFWDTCDDLERTPIIRNDGKKSGNVCFWLFADAQKLANTAEIT